jgi:hypothetical protein
MTPESGDSEGPFLQRWSRRKREPDGEKPAPKAEAADAVSPGVSRAGAEAEARELQLQKNREAAEAIDLETLDAESDFSPFFKEGVPKVLRSAAMRVLWRSSPVFANLDGLNDYDENFGDPELIKKFTGTAWKIGKGYLRDDDETKDDLGGEVAGETPQDLPAETEEPQVVAERSASGDEAPASGNETVDADDKPGEQIADDPKAETSPTEEDDSGLPARVPLRARLALDDWQAD